MNKSMVNSYTLIRVLPIKDKEVFDKITKLPEVKDIVRTYGEYDLIIRVESSSLESLDNFIFNKLREIDGITATTTLLEARPKK